MSVPRKASREAAWVMWASLAAEVCECAMEAASPDSVESQLPIQQCRNADPSGISEQAIAKEKRLSQENGALWGAITQFC